MVSARDNLRLAFASINAFKLRAVLTVLGLTMGVATLMTVMTLVQGANLYVEQKIANLGTNVFRLAKTPFAVVDFTVIVKSLKNKNIGVEDYRAVAELCNSCEQVGASASGTLSVQYKNKQTDDTSIIGYTPNMVDIDTRTLDLGRYFTPGEDRHSAYVCILGASLVDQFFPNENPIGPQYPHREFGIHGCRYFQEVGFCTGSGSRQLRNHPTDNLFESSRRAVQLDA
jgi:putative ABC transport system permease protein